MAKVIGPLHSISATGKFGKGALSYQGSAGRSVVRHVKKAKPKEPTQKQIQVREIVASCVAAWRSLHECDRNAWNTTNGNPRGYKIMLPGYTPRSGYHVFIRRNTQYLLRGGFIVVNPFSHVLVWPIGSISFS